jgi:Protease inhibitor Inh
MSGVRRGRIWGLGGAKAAAVLIMFASLAACSGSDLLGGAKPEPTPAPPPPPPVDLVGRWQLSAASGGACFMTFGKAPSSAGSAAPDEPSLLQGTIAPEGGCPGNFFTSRKWSFEDGALIIRDFKGRPLAQLSYSGDHFQGRDTGGGALTLSKPP